jgi:hypothetical protein
LISSFRLHPLADLTRLWEALHGGKVIFLLNLYWAQFR